MRDQLSTARFVATLISTAVVVASAVVLAGAPGAEAAATPKTINCGASPGLVLDVPGSYTLSTAVLNCASSPIVSITASGVTFDLAGRIIDGNDANTACVMTTGTLSEVKIKNGTVRDCDVGVDISGAGTSSVTGLTVRSMDVNGFRAGSGNTITANTIAGNQGDGISAVNGNTISGNMAAGNVGAGIAADSGNTISKNTAAGNEDIGIFAGNGNTIAGNTAPGNAIYGIAAGSGNTITKNTAAGNGGFGIIANDGNTITKNTAAGNADDGISASDSNTISKNRSAANGGDGIQVADENTITSNSITGNDGAGILVDVADNLVSDTTLKSNIAKGNGLDGILLVDDLDPATTEVSKNTVNGNVQQGIDLAAGTPQGAGTNTAEGNIETPQCDAALCAVPSPAPASSVSIVCGVSPGLVLDTPGSYKLQTAVLNCASSPIVSITASGVTFDLAGRIIDGNDANTACVMTTGTLSEVKIKNGAVRDCNRGVGTGGSTGSSIKGITVRSAVQRGIESGSNATITGNTVATTIQVGILAQSGSTVTGNTAAFNQTGFYNGGGNTVTGNTAAGNLDDGIFADPGGIVTGNNAAGNGGDGIFVHANHTVSGNTAAGNGGGGIVAGPNNTITKNTAAGNIGDGIIGGERSTISKNRSAANGGDGIQADDESTITSNSITGNDGAGILVDAADVCCGGDNIVSDTTLKSNIAKGNGLDGILLVDDLDPATTAISKNTVNGNVQQGIDLAAGTPQGAGTNKADGNIETPQCDAGLC